MKRHFNYTGRVKILREKIKIKICGGSNGDYYFDGEIDLNDLDIKNINSKVYLEFYYRDRIKRFSLGTVKVLSLPKDKNLDEFKNSISSVRLRILVVNEFEGNKIIARADRIKPLNWRRTQKGIIPLEIRDMGNLPWKIEYDEDEGPILVLNSKPNDFKELLKRDSKLGLSIYSAVFREILCHIFFYEKYNKEAMEIEGGWQNDWIRFAKKFVGNPPLNEENNPAEIFEWINNCVCEFCQQIKSKYTLENGD